MFDCPDCKCPENNDSDGLPQLVDVTELVVKVIDPAITASESNPYSGIESRELSGKLAAPFTTSACFSRSNFNLALSDSAIKDCYNNYLIVVGEGEHLLEVAQARLKQGLRLCVVDVKGISSDRLGTVQGDTLSRAWDPPPYESSKPTCKLGKALAAYKPRHWLLRGPDIVGLLPGQWLDIVEVEGHGIGVVVKDETGTLVWALEGYVMNLAGVSSENVPSLRQFLKEKEVEYLMDQVAPDYQEAKPYGMFDKAHVFLSAALILPLLGLNITGWMLTAHFDLGVREICRGLFLFMLCVPIYRFGSSFWGEAFAGHYTSPTFHVIITTCSVVVSMVIPFLFRALGLGIPSTMTMVSGGAMTLIGCSVVQLCWQRRMGRLRNNFWSHLRWGCTIVALSFGVWILLYVAASVYIQLVSMQSSLSVIFLPVATWLLECGTVLASTAPWPLTISRLRNSTVQ